MIKGLGLLVVGGYKLCYLLMGAGKNEVFSLRLTELFPKRRIV